MKSNTKKLTITALFTALICVATFLVKIPTPAVGGYIHMGDAFVILSGIVLGPLGSIASALGSALADLVSGYALYMPITFVIKGIMALITGIIWYKNTSKSRNNFVRCILCGVIAALIMVGGYLGFELIIYGKAAFLNVPFNLIQGLSGIVVSAISLPLVYKIFKLK